MKKIYLLHLLSLILLLFIGYNFLKELTTVLEAPQISEGAITDWAAMSRRIRSEFLTNIYAVCSLLIFAFSVFVGWKVRAIFSKLGQVLILGGLVFFVWTIVMLKFPDGIRIQEVFPILIAYVIIAICGSIYGLLNLKKVPSLGIDYEDEILDEEMNQ